MSLRTHEYKIQDRLKLKEIYDTLCEVMEGRQKIVMVNRYGGCLSLSTEVQRA